jgi:hypothetical protein
MIILSKCPDLCLFWGSVQRRAERLAVNINFKLLGLKSDSKEGGIPANKTLKCKSLHFHNINNLQYEYTDHNNS